MRSDCDNASFGDAAGDTADHCTWPGATTDDTCGDTARLHDASISNNGDDAQLIDTPGANVAGLPDAVIPLAVLQLVTRPNR